MTGLNRQNGEGVPTLVIQPSRGWRFLSLGELWKHRELLYFLTWRDVKVRYKQTLIGAAWAIIQLFSPWSFSPYSSVGSRVSLQRVFPIRSSATAASCHGPSLRKE
jgi:hypothetical protein